MFGSDFAGAEQRINDWQGMLEERARRAAEVSDQMRDLTAHGEAEEGAVRVILDRSGNLTDLELNQHVSGWPSERIRRALLNANASARADLAERVRRTLDDAGFYGDGR